MLGMLYCMLADRHSLSSTLARPAAASCTGCPVFDCCRGAVAVCGCPCSGEIKRAEVDMTAVVRALPGTSNLITGQCRWLCCSNTQCACAACHDAVCNTLSLSLWLACQRVPLLPALLVRASITCVMSASRHHHSLWPG